MPPIFFAWTRSFWATVVGFAILFFGAPAEVVQGASQLLAWALPWSADEIGAALLRIAPMVLWAFAMQQRSGSARPYTTDPRALR